LRRKKGDDFLQTQGIIYLLNKILLEYKPSGLLKKKAKALHSRNMTVQFIK
jgi:hypothetical protein